jgi:hypothetical protein
MPTPMTMPLFVDPQDVILRMQLSADLTGIEDVITSGIMSAQLHVERVIDGKLARQAQTCRYFIDAESFSGIAPGGLYRLEVPSGLVRQDEPQVVTVGTEASSGPFNQSYEAIDPGLMTFDYPRGYLYVDAGTYANTFVKIECTTGYEDGTRPLPITGLTPWNVGTQYAAGDIVDSGGTAYRCLVTNIGTPPPAPAYWALAYVPQETIPHPIYEAIMSLVPMVFNAQQTTSRSNEAKTQYQALTDHANLLLQPYMRTQGFTFRSI